LSKRSLQSRSTTIDTYLSSEEELDFSDLLKFVVFVTVSSLGAWFVIYSTVEINTTQEDGKEVLELPELEQNQIRSRAVATIAFHKGDITKEFPLKDQIYLIVKKNSWLTGRLISRKFQGKFGKNIISLCFSNVPSVDELSTYCQEVLISDKILNESLPFDKIIEVTSRYLLKKCNCSIDKPYELLFEVTLLKDLQRE
jgi:hypothetical protein